MIFPRGRQESKWNWIVNFIPCAIIHTDYFFQVHFTNCLPVVDKVLLAFRPLLKEKLIHKVSFQSFFYGNCLLLLNFYLIAFLFQFHFHTNIETLYNYVDRKILPQEYGGDAGTFAELNGKYIFCFRTLLSHFWGSICILWVSPSVVKISDSVQSPKTSNLTFYREALNRLFLYSISLPPKIKRRQAWRRSEARWGSCHKRQKPQALTPQVPIRNRHTRKVANAKDLNRNTNLT